MVSIHSASLAGNPVALRLLKLFVLQLFIKVSRLFTFLRINFGRPRSLWGVTPIHTINLNAKCDEKLGFKSRSLVFVQYFISKNFSYNFSKILQLIQAQNSGMEKPFYWLVFLYCLLRYDNFNFFYDRGIFPSDKGRGINEFELKILKAAGKRIFVYPYGGDVRVRQTTLDLGQFNCCMDCDRIAWHCICSKDLASANVEIISKYANAIIGMGDMSLYTPGSYDFQFWPIEPENYENVSSIRRDKSQALRILHAPNHSQFKGTAYFEKAVKKLQENGYRVDYRKIEKLPNNLVIQEMMQADIIFDQLINGFHGYTTVESMALGRPVICFIRDETMVPNWENCPILCGSPSNIYELLLACIEGKLDLENIGAQSRAYAEKYYSLDAVALNMCDLYLERGGYPSRLKEKIEAKKIELKYKIEAVEVAHSSGPYFHASATVD